MSRQFRPITVTPDIAAKMDRYAIKSDAGCWEWQRYINNKGYGVVCIDGTNFYAHRASYTLAHGPIPDGLVIDHLCRNTKCINPDHLEAVTDQTNTLRGMAPGAKAQRRDACLRGHLYSEYGKVWGVRRHCTACQAIHLAAYKARHAATKSA